MVDITVDEIYETAMCQNSPKYYNVTILKTLPNFIDFGSSFFKLTQNCSKCQRRESDFVYNVSNTNS